MSVLLPFVSQYASHLYCNTPPICIAILLGKSWWLWSPECSPSFASPEQRHFLCEQGKIRDAPLLSETLQTRYTPVKRDRISNFQKSKAWSASRTRSERDRNEIQICKILGQQGQDRVAPQYTLGFPCWSARCPEKPQKRDARLKNEIGMNLGK